MFAKTDEHVVDSVTAQDSVLADCHQKIEDAVHDMKTLDDSEDEATDDLGELDYDDDGTQDLDELEKLAEQSIAEAEAASQVSAPSPVSSSASQADKSMSSHQDSVAVSTTFDQADDQSDTDKSASQLNSSSSVDSTSPNGQAVSQTNSDQSLSDSGQTAQSQRQRQRRQMREAAEAGTFVTAFTAEVGGNKAKLTTANQYVAYKYYEKAWKAGVRLNPADKVPEKLRDGSNVNDMHDAMLALYRSTKEQLGIDLFSNQENKQFKLEALHMQADNNPSLKQALGWAEPEPTVPDMPFGQTKTVTTGVSNDTSKKPGGGNSGASNGPDDGLDF